jgi:hypothetical protein
MFLDERRNGVKFLPSVHPLTPHLCSRTSVGPTIFGMNGCARGETLLHSIERRSPSLGIFISFFFDNFLSQLQLSANQTKFDIYIHTSTRFLIK